MLNKSGLAVVLVLLFGAALFAQEMEKSDSPVMPPKPLSGEWQEWLVGEWQGTSESNMGKTKDWMKVEWGPGKQFLVMHYRGETIEVNKEMAAQAAKQMKISLEEMEKMMHEEYTGLGMTTLDPKTGEPMGFWFDSYRDVSKGSGSVKDGKHVMVWTSKAMGTMTRTTEKLGPDKMKITMQGKDPSGMEWSGTAVMTRVK